MLEEMEDPAEIVLTFTEAIDFRTAKKINNDFMDILRALSKIEMRTEVGEEVKEKFMEIVTYELQRLEESKMIL